MGLLSFLSALVVVAKPLGEDTGSDSTHDDDKGFDNYTEAESSISGEFASKEVQSETQLSNEASCTADTQQTHDFTKRWCDDAGESNDVTVVTPRLYVNNTTRATRASMSDLTLPHNKWDVANTRPMHSSSPDADMLEECRFAIADQNENDLTMDARISAMPTRRNFPTRQMGYQRSVNDAVVMPEDIKQLVHTDQYQSEAIHKADNMDPPDIVEEMKKDQLTNTYNSRKADHASEKEKRDRDVEECIRQLLSGRTPPRRDNFYDAAVVYEREDYAEVNEFTREVKQICAGELTEEPRIELFDSEVFNQSQIAVVEDLFRRCSILFVYLTPNCSSRHFQYVVEEAIGLSRLDLSSAMTQASLFRQRECVVKPVHTEPISTRSYKTPIGLVTQKGLDWYNRYSDHTRGQVRQMMKSALIERKRNEGYIFPVLPVQTNDYVAKAQPIVQEMATPDNAGQYQQGVKPPQAHRVSSVSEDVISFESGHWDRPLMSTPVSQEPSYPPNQQELHRVSLSRNDRPNFPRARKDNLDTHSFAAPKQRFSPPAGRFQHEAYFDKPDVRYDVHESQYNFHQGRPSFSGNVLSTKPNRQFLNEYPSLGQQTPFQSARIHNSRSSQDGPTSETLFEQSPTHREPMPNFNPLLSPEVQTLRRSYSNEPHITIGVGENNTSMLAPRYIPVINKSHLISRNLHVPSPTPKQQEQPVMWRTLPRDGHGAREGVKTTPAPVPLRNENGFIGSRMEDIAAPPVSASASRCVSAAASSAILQPPFESATPNLSVVSKVTGELIINKNLSTDDVEIDAGIKYKARRGKTKQTRIRSRSASSSSDESDSDSEVGTTRGPRSRSKTINIVGSSIVQLGKHNVVHGAKARSSNKRVTSKEGSRDLEKDRRSYGQKRKNKSEERATNSYPSTKTAGIAGLSDEISLNEDQMSFSISSNLLDQHPSKHLPEKNISIRDHQSMEDGDLDTRWELMSDLKENSYDAKVVGSECSLPNGGYREDNELNNQKVKAFRQTVTFWNNFDDNESPTENNFTENDRFKTAPLGGASKSLERETQDSSAEQPLRGFRLINPLIAYVKMNIVPVSVDADELD